jgi:hypothetical protein
MLEPAFTPTPHADTLVSTPYPQIGDPWLTNLPHTNAHGFSRSRGEWAANDLPLAGLVLKTMEVRAIDADLFPCSWMIQPSSRFSPPDTSGILRGLPPQVSMWLTDRP